MKNFKQTALTAALAMVVASPLASAAAPAGGFDAFVSGAIGYGTTDSRYAYQAYYDYDVDWYSGSGKDDTNNTLGQFRATAAYTDKSGFGGQMDYVYNYDKNDWVDLSTTDVVGHAFYRGGDWLVGGLVQRRTFDIEGGEGFHLPVKMTVWGLEGQKQFGNMSLTAQLGKQTLNAWGWEPDGWIGSVGANYFINDNLLVNGRITYGTMDAGEGSSSGSYTQRQEYKNTALEIGGEYRLPNSAFSVFGTYTYRKDEYKYRNTEDYGYYVYTGNGDTKLHQVMVGVKLNFGKETLRKRDRDGASLNPMALSGGLFTID